MVERRPDKATFKPEIELNSPTNKSRIRFVRCVVQIDAAAISVRDQCLADEIGCGRMVG